MTNTNDSGPGSLSFTTGLPPDNAVLQSAILKIKQSGVPVGADPLHVLGGLLVDTARPYFGSLAGLQLGDFTAAGSAAKVATFNATPSNGWYSAKLNNAGLSSINETGLTQFRLYFTLDDNNDHLANTMRFFSGDAVAGSRPNLDITYTVL